MTTRSAGLLLLLAVLLLAAPAPASAQTPEEEVEATIGRLFDGMRAGDSTMVRSVFHETAALYSVGEREGNMMLIEGSVDRFVNAVGTPHDQVWDERIWDLKIQVDGHLASAWMNYAFYLGDTFSHCGVNSFQLFRGSDGWQTIYLVDTRRRDGCDLPAEE